MLIRVGDYGRLETCRYQGGSVEPRIQQVTAFFHGRGVGAVALVLTADEAMEFAHRLYELASDTRRVAAVDGKSRSCTE